MNIPNDDPAGEIATAPHLPLILVLLPIFTLVVTILASALTLGFSSDILLLAILSGALVAGLLAIYQGASWDDIQAETGRRLADAFPAILILLSIGALLGSWMFSGTIPLMVVIGIDLINPQYMALTAFLLTAGMSLISGTSWGSAGTIGVALMAAATAMEIPLAPVAGAVVSGAYLGDKLSPLSDMTNIAAIGAGAELYTHIQHMLWTSVPPAIIAIIIFAAIGFNSNAADGIALAKAQAVQAQLIDLYRFNLVVALPLLVALLGIVFRLAPALIITGSSILALAVGIGVQDFPVAAAAATFANGFDITMVAPEAAVSANLSNLLNRGGVFSMAPTLMFIIAAFILAAAMETSGALARLLSALLSAVHSTFGLVTATMAAGLVIIGITSHGGVTSLIVGGLFGKSYRERALAPENLSRAIEDSVTVTEPLMPWTVSGLFMATTLGVATLDYAPWAVFCLLCPVFSLLLAFTHQRFGFGLKPLALTSQH